MQETADQYRERMFSQVGGNDPMKLQAAAPVEAREASERSHWGKGAKAPSAW